MKISHLVGLSVILIASANALACPTDRVVVTKPGYYGALNQDVYDTMDDALRRGDNQQLAALIEQKSVIEIPAGQKGCVVSDATAGFYKQQEQIEVVGLPVPYWVSNVAVTPVK